MTNECKLVQQSAPFSGYVEKSVLPVKSDLYHALKEAEIDIENAFVSVNGRRIAPLDLIHTVPKTGDVVEVDIVPTNSDNGKIALRTVALIAVAVAAAYAGPALFTGSKFLATAASVGITVGGSLAVNALIPPPTAALVAGTASNLERDYAITGSSNSYAPYGPIPKIFGKHRIYPPKAALEYTELIGNEQYLNSLFCIGYGPLNVTEIQIGETPIASYGEAEYEIGNLTSPPSLFPSLVDEQSLSIQLDKVNFPSVGNWTTVNTVSDTRRISLDFFMPTIFGPESTHWVDFFVEVSRDGGPWVDILNPSSGYGITVVNAEHDYLGGVIYGEWVIRAYSDGSGSKRCGIFFNTPAVDNYSIRVARRSDTTTPWTAPDVSDDAYLTAVRSFVNDNPIKTTDSTIQYIALRLRASDKLNGVVDNFNCVCEAQHPVYNGSVWADQVTRNPAWMLADLLTGGATPNPISTDKLNGAEFLEWANINDTEGFYFDLILSKHTVINELAKQICAVGRAVPTIKDGLHTVVIDKEQTTPSQIFTSRNSWGFQGIKIFTERIHGFKCNFVNRDNGYVVDEVIAYDDGYNAGNATKFEKLSFSGVTDPDHAWKLGRYHIAVNRLRPETYEINVDVENIRCTRGDLVYLNYDVILVGLGGGRIKDITLGTPSGGFVDFTFVIDDKKILESTKTYAINVRTNSGTIYTLVLDTPPISEIDTDTITGNTTETIANAIEEGNLFQFGESGAVSDEMIIQYIEPGDELTAKLTLVHYNAAILNADQGTIPAFVSNITQPPDPTKFVPSVPEINQVLSDETVIIVQEDGSLTSRIVINFNIPASGSSILPRSLETQYRLTTNAEGGWLSVPPVDASFDTVSIVEVQDGFQYTLRIRFVSPYGVPSEWNEVTHTVIGKTSPPPDVTGFIAVFVDNQIELRWNASPVPDIRDYQLSYGTVAGDNDLGFTDATTFRMPALFAGTRTFWIIAYDTSGNFSGAVFTDLLNTPPTVTDLTAEVIDNNVLLRWVNVQGSIPILSNTIRQGPDYDNPVKEIGNKTGSFTTFQETAADDYTYWVTATDSAGNVGPAASLVVGVSEPPDFVLFSHVFKGFADGSLYTNCFANEVADQLYIPVNIAETWTQHFVNNSFTTFQDFIDAGYTTYTEPTLSTGEYNEEFDMGAVIPTAIITVLIDKTDVGPGTVTFDTYIEYKKLPGDSWITNGIVTTLQATDFRYVRVRYEVAVDDDETYTIVNKQTVDVSVKEKTDSGNGDYTVGYALTSDTTNDYYASAPDSVSLDITGSVSVEAWVRLPTVTGTGTTNIAFKTYYGLQYNATTGQIIGGGSQGNTTWDIDSDWEQHWVHILDVITASAHVLYINGEEVDSQSGYSPTTTTNSFYVLGDGGTGGCPASVSRVRVFSGEVTAAEADAMFKDNTVDPAATLEAEWDFSEGTGTTTADTSANSNTMTLSSTSMWDDDEGLIVFFNKTFIDVESITLTASIDRTDPTNIMYDFLDIPYPEYFHVLPYSASAGTRKASAFSWKVRGK